MENTLEINGVTLYGLKYHHSALRRGYLGIKNTYGEVYEGRFGKGVIMHYPTRDSACSNEYHRIEYYIAK